MHLAIKILIIYGVALRVGTSQTTPIKPNFELFQTNTWTRPSLDMALKPTLKNSNHTNEPLITSTLSDLPDSSHFNKIVRLLSSMYILYSSYYSYCSIYKDNAHASSWLEDCLYRLTPTWLNRSTRHIRFGYALAAITLKALCYQTIAHGLYRASNMTLLDAAELLIIRTKRLLKTLIIS